MKTVARLQSTRYDQPGTHRVKQSGVISVNIQNVSTESVAMILGGIDRIIPPGQLVNSVLIPTSFVIETSPFPLEFEVEFTITARAAVVVDLAVVHELEIEKSC